MLKIINYYLRGRLERYYLKNKWHLLLDLSLIIIVISLSVLLISLYNYHPNIITGLEPEANKKLLDLNNPPLNVDFSIANPSFKVGSSIGLHLKIANQGQREIKNATIKIESSDNNFLVKSLKLVGKIPPLVTSYGNVLELSVPINTNQEIDLEVLVSRLLEQTRVLKWRAELTYELNDHLLKKKIDLPELVTLADLSVKQLAYYTSPQGDQLGVGPLPPIVGLPTSYWIFWETQSVDEWRDLIVSARLPRGVELGGRRSLLAGDFNYSSSTRLVTWKVKALTTSSDSYRLGFEVEIIPIASQLDKVLPLTENAKYYAVDVLGKKEVEGLLTPVNTNLEDDRFNHGQGIVTSEMTEN